MILKVLQFYKFLNIGFEPSNLNQIQLSFYLTTKNYGFKSNFNRQKFINNNKQKILKVSIKFYKD